MGKYQPYACQFIPHWPCYTEKARALTFTASSRGDTRPHGRVAHLRMRSAFCPLIEGGFLHVMRLREDLDRAWSCKGDKGLKLPQRQRCSLSLSLLGSCLVTLRQPSVKPLGATPLTCVSLYRWLGRRVKASSSHKPVRAGARSSSTVATKPSLFTLFSVVVSQVSFVFCEVFGTQNYVSALWFIIVRGDLCVRLPIVCVASKGTRLCGCVCLWALTTTKESHALGSIIRLNIKNSVINEWYVRTFMCACMSHACMCVFVHVCAHKHMRSNNRRTM